MDTILMKTVILHSAFLWFLMSDSVTAEYELPVSHGSECDRDCDADPDPRTFVYNFVLEQYTTMGGACDHCTPNVTNNVANDCSCVLADGVERSILTANRMIPGPAIFACQGDEIVVYVKNHLESSETTIHWHGLHQEGTPYFDGVPFVTQCPILYGNTFRYKFWAAQSGTFFWHSHSGLQKYNGLSGSLVIKGKRSLDPNRHLYDYDLCQHVIFLQDWLDRRAEEVFPGNLNRRPNQLPTNILVNGMGKVVFNGSRTEVPFATFEVIPGFKYRFRLINAFASACPATFTIEGHNLTLIATDAYPVKPVAAKTIASMTGERYDFSVHANQSVGCYWIEIFGLGGCFAANVTQLAILKYEGATCEAPSTPEPTHSEPLPSGTIINPVNATYNNRVPNSVPLTYLDNAISDDSILRLTPSRTFFIPFSLYEVEDTQEFFQIHNHDHFLVNSEIHHVGIMNNISYSQPNAPLLSQPKDVYKKNICNYTTCRKDVCHCTNILKLKYGEVVDMFFIDTVDNEDLYHPIHIHGMNFHVLAMGYARDLNLKKISRQGVYDAFTGYKIPMHSHTETCYPIMKDTIAIPTNGYALVRVVPKNPGIWFVHCHVDVHISVGMSMVIQVGEPCDFPPVPSRFPRCNDYLG